MKVRHKKTKQAEFVSDVVSASGIGMVVYLFMGGTWGYASDYEPLPTETWRNVTDDCGFVEGQGERDGIKHFGPSNAVCMIYAGYRFRKVRVYSPFESDPKDVFIIEQREP